ncbi:MAG: septum formation initiator family protein [Candidatus Thiothrix singaporensis]|uniref:Cell division protein FtsB n=1 Tax=Candidatus Thiothrix singaporensis TaxID=2799669 RepID=A0A7L6APX4_9GAMM|nr:MAG: septum formation initiator family protein [Candidatus Thiothrix singaporensis]
MSMTRILFLVLGLVALGLFVRLWVGSGSYSDIQNLEQKIDQQNAANDEQAELKRKLQSDVVSLSKGDASVEEHARSELGMIRQGETFYQVILKSDPTPMPGLTPPSRMATTC